MSESGAAQAPPRKRGFLAVTAWVLWGAVLAVAVVFLWQGWAIRAEPRGATKLMYGLALLFLTPYVPLRALASWRCRRAARRLPDPWRSGTAELPGWPGVRERAGVLSMRCGSGSVRLWALALGLGLSGYLFGQLSRGTETVSAFRLVLSLAPAVCAALLSLLWGPAGWQLSVDSARSQAMLVLWRPLRRTHVSTASLPTVQGVSLPQLRGGGYRGILVRRAAVADWKLGIPGTWPPELVEALALRMANLAGVEFGKEDEKGGPREEKGAPVEETAE